MASQRSVKVALLDGATSEITIYTNQTPKPDAPLLLLHCALGVQASYYSPLAENFTSLGYIFVVAESRGVGTSSIRPNRKVDYGHYQMIANDFPVHMETVKTLYPDNPLYLIGHSLGGHLQVLYLALQLKKGDIKYVNEVKGLLFIASGSVYWRYFGFKLFLLSYIVRFVSWLFGWWPGKWFGFGGTAAMTQMRDWCYEVQNGKWMLSKCPYPELDSLIGQINIPSYWLSIEGDIYTVRGAAAAFRTKLASSKSTHEHFTPQELDLPWRGPEVHFRWARKSQVVVEKAHKWIQSLVID